MSSKLTLIDDTTLRPDCAAADFFYARLSSNVTCQSPINPSQGQVVTLDFQQNGSGSWVVSFGGSWLFDGGVAPVLPTPAGSRMVLRVIRDGGDWVELSRSFPA